MRRRIPALLLAMTMLLGAIPAALAAGSGAESSEWTVEAQELPGSLLLNESEGREPLSQPKYADDEMVTVMVQLNAPALLDGYGDIATISTDGQTAGEAVAEYIGAAYEEGIPQELEAMQDSVLQEISALFPSTYSTISARPAMEPVARWTTLVNAFAVRVPYGLLDEINEIGGVKRAYVERTYTLPENESISHDTVGTAGYSYDMVGLDTAWGAGYTGQGMVVAILDTGLDLEWSIWSETPDPDKPNIFENVEGLRHVHQAFSDDSFYSEDPKSFVRYADEDAVMELVNSNSLDATQLLSVAKRGYYKTLKVPYAFDYAVGATDEEGNVLISGDLNVYPGEEGEEHGTHVAGTAAGFAKEADGRIIFSGVAPDAQILAMKVFDDTGALTYEQYLLSALEDSVALGADVINLSLGADSGFADDDTMEGDVCERVAEAGVIMMTSAGNSYFSGQNNNLGDNDHTIYDGDYYLTDNPDISIMSSPAVYESNIAIASINSTVTANSILYWGANDQDSVKASYMEPFEGSMVGQFSDEYISENKGNLNGIPIYDAGYGEYSDFAGVFGYSYNLQKTGIALVKRGSSSGYPMTFETKINNAEQFRNYNGTMGVLGVIFYDPEDTSDEPFGIGVGDIPKVVCCCVSGNTGKAIAQAITEGKEPYLKSVSAQPEISQWSSGGKMSEFTSWGASPTLQLKPELTAPGGNIWSALFDGEYERDAGNYNDYEGSYGMMSGTSMAAPHMTGLAAIVKQYVNKQVTLPSGMGADRMTSLLLMSTALPQSEDGAFYSPRRQGAGLVNVGAAITTPAYITVADQTLDKIELGDRVGDSFELTFTVHNMSNEALTYSPQVTVMRPGTGSYGNGQVHVLDSDVELNASVDTGSISVSPNSSTTVTLTVTIDGDAAAETDRLFQNGTYVEGYVVLNSSVGKPQIGLPFMGFRGDWTKAPIFDTAMWFDSCIDGESKPNGGWTKNYDDIFDLENHPCTWGPSIVSFYTGSDFIDLGVNLADPSAVGTSAPQTVFHRENFAISPNDDGRMDTVNNLNLLQLRDAKVIVFEVRNADNGDLYYSDYLPYMTRSYYYTDGSVEGAFPVSANYIIPWDGTDMNGAALPDGTKCTFTIMAFGDGEYKGDKVPEESYGNTLRTNFELIDLKKQETWPTFNGHEMNTEGDVIEFPLLIDLRAPELENSTIKVTKSDGKYHIKGRVTDSVGSIASVSVYPEAQREYNGKMEYMTERYYPYLNELLYTPALGEYEIDTDLIYTGYSDLSGNVIIALTDYAGNERDYVIRIKGMETPDELLLSQTSARLHVGSSFDLTVVDNTNPGGSIVRTSSDPNVASVDDYGHVVGLHPGQTIITVEKGSRTATCMVVVDEWPTEVEDFSLSIDRFSTLSPDGGITVKVVDLQPADVIIDPDRSSWIISEDDETAQNYAGLVNVTSSSGDFTAGEIFLNYDTVGTLVDEEGKPIPVPAGSGVLNVTLNGVTRSMTIDWAALYQSEEDDGLISDVSTGDGDQAVYVTMGETAVLVAKYRQQGHETVPVKLYTAKDFQEYGGVNSTDPAEGLWLEGPDFAGLGSPWTGKLIAQPGFELPDKDSVHVCTRYPSDNYETSKYDWDYDPETGEISVNYAPYGADSELVIRADGKALEGANLENKQPDNSGYVRPDELYGPFEWTVTEDSGGSLQTFVGESIGYSIKNGARFTPSKPGVSYIRAATKDGRYHVDFAVICEPVLAESMTVEDASVDLPVGETCNLKNAVTLTPEPTLDKNRELLFTSYNEDVATVDENGIVTAVSEGYAYILVKLKTDTMVVGACVVHVSNNDSAVKVVGDPEVSAPDGAFPENVQKDEKDEIINALKSSTPSANDLNAAVGTVSVNADDITKAKEALEQAPDVTVNPGDNVRVVAETYLKIGIGRYTEVDDSKTLAVDISAHYRLLATTAGDDADIVKSGEQGQVNAVAMEGTEKEVSTNSPVTLWIGLPMDFTDADKSTMLVRHSKGGNDYHYHPVKVTHGGDKTLTATFTSVDGLSPFVFFSTEPEDAVAMVNGYVYTTLQKAVNAASDGDVITIYKPDCTATVGRELTVTLVGASGVVIDEDMLTAVGSYRKECPTPGTFTFTYVPAPAPSLYSVAVVKPDHCDVTANNSRAVTGTEITVVVNPERDYHVSNFTVTSASGAVVAVKDNKDGTYTFTMPASNVTVTTTVYKCPSIAYSDLDVTQWYHTYVDYAITHGLMQGFDDGVFGTDSTVTRAQMAGILWNLEGKPVVNYLLTFTDVPEGKWYTEAIRWAVSERIVSGFGDGTFKPDDIITREQMAAMLYFYEQKLGTGGFTGEWMFNLTFDDADEISDWAREAVAWCTMKGIITGSDNKFDPAGTSKRFQLATILALYDQMEK